MEKSNKFRIIKPYICFDEVEKDFKEIFTSGILTKGEYVEKFKQEINKFTESKYCFLTTSATTALTMALKTVDVGPGDEVIISDFSFPATANVVEDLGAIPVFADVDIETFNMKPDELRQKINGKTKAVIYVDALGNPSGVFAIKAICKEAQIPLIEDSACAIGSEISGQKIGNVADLTCFSFHPRKMVTTGEGGAILTNNSSYAKSLEVKFNHGAVLENERLDFITYGYNYRLPELQAAMGIVQIKKLKEIIHQRSIVRSKYVEHLTPLGFTVQKTDDDVVYNVQSIVFIVPTNVNRDHLIQYLKQYQIESTIGTYCLSNTTYFRNKYNQVQPNAKFLEENTLTLPCFEGIQVEEVCKVIKEFMKIISAQTQKWEEEEKY
jgi:perosamine synthetase